MKRLINQKFNWLFYFLLCCLTSKMLSIPYMRSFVSQNSERTSQICNRFWKTLLIIGNALELYGRIYVKILNYWPVWFFALFCSGAESGGESGVESSTVFSDDSDSNKSNASQPPATPTKQTRSGRTLPVYSPAKPNILPEHLKTTPKKKREEEAPDSDLADDLQTFAVVRSPMKRLKEDGDHWWTWHRRNSLVLSSLLSTCTCLV